MNYDAISNGQVSRNQYQERVQQAENQRKANSVSRKNNQPLISLIVSNITKLIAS